MDLTTEVKATFILAQEVLTSDESGVKHLEDAIIDLQSAILKFKDESIFYSARGDCFKTLFDYKSAISCYRTALRFADDDEKRKIRKNLCESLMSLGLLYLKQPNFAEFALGVFNGCLDLNPSLWRVWIYKTVALVNQGSFGEAFQTINRLCLMSYKKLFE